VGLCPDKRGRKGGRTDSAHFWIEFGEHFLLKDQVEVMAALWIVSRLSTLGRRVQTMRECKGGRTDLEPSTWQPRNDPCGQNPPTYRQVMIPTASIKFEVVGELSY
jgi:hypothetical protein